MQDKNVALSVDPPLFGADILDEIRAINRHSLRKAENYRENYERLIYEHRCREEVDLSELPSQVSYSLRSSNDSITTPDIS